MWYEEIVFDFNVEKRVKHVATDSASNMKKEHFLSSKKIVMRLILNFCTATVLVLVLKFRYF